jgi:heme exporter protein B
VTPGVLWREAMLVAGKDLRIERRARVTLNQVLPFGVLVLVLFSFALDPARTLDDDRSVLEVAAPGLLWVAVLLALLLAVGRAFAVEAENGALDGLRLAGLDPGAVFLGKALAIAAQLLVLEVVLAVGVVLLYDLEPAGVPMLLLAAFAATAGLAAAGTVYGSLAAGLRVRETLLPLLVVPMVAPVMLGATRTWEAAIERTPSHGWPWLGLLGVFALVYVALGMSVSGPLLEES